MIKIFFVLAIATVASASNTSLKLTCPDLKAGGYIAKTPQTLAEVTAKATELATLELKAKDDYAKLVLAEGDKFRSADKTANEEMRKCGDDSECTKRVAEWLRQQHKDFTEAVAEIKAEEVNCNQAFAFVYSTQVASGVANTLKQLIALYPENVRLVGDINLLPIEEASRDSDVFNLIYARRTKAAGYAMGEVGVWYDLETANGVQRVAGIISGSHYVWSTRGNLVQSLQTLQQEKIPSYGLNLDRVTSKFLQGDIKHQYNYYFSYGGGYYNRSAGTYSRYGDVGYFGNARASLGLITFGDKYKEQ